MIGGYRKYESTLEAVKVVIDNSKNSRNTKNLFWEYYDERKANGFKEESTKGLLFFLRKFGEYVKKDLDKVKKEDVKRFFNETLQCSRCREIFDKKKKLCPTCKKELTPLKPSTELWYKKILRRFYSWLADYKEKSSIFDCVRWIDTRSISRKCHQDASKRREDNLPKPEQVREMIKHATFLRDKLAISLLADTGIRAESIGANKNKRSIDIGQIEFKENYAIIHDIHEKFDKRRDVIVIEALSYLVKYYNEHPLKDDLEAPLFLNYSTNRRNQRWGYSGLKDMLHKVSKETVGRIINPHDFRHLKGTRLHLDETISDDAKCKLMGWSSRRMLDRYNHTTFEDAKDEYLVKKGIIKLDKHKKKKLQSAILIPRQCPRCEHINTPTDEICESCGMGLDVSKIIKEYEILKQAEEDVTEILSDKRVQKLVKEIYKLKLNEMKK